MCVCVLYYSLDSLGFFVTPLQKISCHLLNVCYMLKMTHSALFIDTLFTSKHIPPPHTISHLKFAKVL